MASPRTSIFISHVNGDPDAEEVLRALVDEHCGLKHELGPDYDGYELFWDRQIDGAEDWRKKICEKLCDCAAAVILVSKGALGPDRPWVGYETFFLTTTKSGSREDLCIVPVYLKGVEPDLAKCKTFDANDLRRYQPLRYPGDRDLTNPATVVSRVATIIKGALTRRQTDRLTGLERVLAKSLSKLPDVALTAAIDRLDPDRNWSRDPDVVAKNLAQNLAKADEGAMLGAFGDLCDEARDRRYLNDKHHIAQILGTLRLREDHARPITIEAALPADAACGRALLLAYLDPKIVDLYISRATGKQPHPWRVLDVAPVLENGSGHDFKESVSRIVALNLGKEAGADYERQLKLARDTIPKRRRAGRPALVRVAHATTYDPRQVLETVRSVSPELMLLFSAKPGDSPEQISETAVLRLTGVEDHDDLSGALNAMRQFVDETTPEEEGGK